MIRDRDHRAAPGNTMQVARGAFAFDAESFEKLLKKLLAGRLANRVRPGDVQFHGQEKLFEHRVNRGLREQGASGVRYGMGSRHREILHEQNMERMFRSDAGAANVR
jgi:hypothetical protein